MKKLVAVALCALVLLSSVGALAYNTQSYSIHSTSNSVLTSGCSAVPSTGSDWYISMSSHNLSSTKKAVVRIHCGYNAASASWVYSGPSSTKHGYNPGYTSGGYGVDIRGRNDTTNAVVNLTMSGVFYH